MERRKIFRCPKCGGMDVVARAWVNPNGLPKSPFDVDWLDEDDVFCRDCGVTYTSWEVQVADVAAGPDGDAVRLKDGTLVPLGQWLKDNPVPGDHTTMYGDGDEDEDDGGEG